MKRKDSKEVKKLVEKARNGSGVAFGKLYDLYFAPLYRFIYFRARSKEDAEDLTQTVFTKAFASIEKYEEKGIPFSVWLYTIARNQTIDYWKKKKDVILDKPEEIFNELPSREPGPQQQAEKKEAGKRLQDAIKELSPDQQEVVILRSIEDRPYREISEILNKSEEAVRALKHRALKVLKEILEKEN